MSTKTFEDVLERIQEGAGCIGPYDEPHRCSLLHCDHCGVCNIMAEVRAAHQAALEAKERESRMDELEKSRDRFKPGAWEYVWHQERIDAVAQLKAKED